MGSDPVPTRRTDAGGLADEGVRLRVLLIDDEAVLTVALARLLRHHDVAVCHGGHEALQRLVLERFDAVLCDLHLDDLDGKQIHERLAHSAPEQAARFVFITGGGCEPTLAGYLKQVSQPVLIKPIRRDQLEQAIRAVANSNHV